MIAEKFSNRSTLFALPDFSVLSTPKELALLILLATEQSLSLYSQFYFDVRKEAVQITKRFPIHFVVNYSESILSRSDSNMKLLTNSRYYLLSYLGKYAMQKMNYQNILQAYKYIYSRISNAENEFYVPRKMLDFIKFDVLNDVFYRNNRTVIELIKYIYEGLEDVMNVNPQFKHQRAKSIFWMCPDEYSEIKEAAKYVDLARHDIENILKTKDNEKLKISLEHTKYTQASIYGRVCALEHYIDKINVIKSVNYYYEALSSSENTVELDALKEKKAEKHIYQDLISILNYLVHCDYKQEMEVSVSNLAKMINYKSVGD